MVTLAKPTILLLKPILLRIPFLKSKFKNTQYNYSSEYANSYQLSSKSRNRRFSGSKAGWTRADDAENSVTVTNGRDADSDHAVGVSGDAASDEGILREDFKGGIMRTVDVDVRAETRHGPESR